MQSKIVHYLVIDGLADWEAALALAHIEHPAPGISTPYLVRTVGVGQKSVRSLGGLNIVPDMELGALSPADSAMLILPGSDAWMHPGLEVVLDTVKLFVQAEVPVAAICGAVFGLARAGILDTRRHSSNDAGWLTTSGYRGAALHNNEPATEDCGVITAASTASVEFARLILTRLEVLPPAAIDPWYGLYKTGAAAHYYAFMKAIG